MKNLPIWALGAALLSGLGACSPTTETVELADSALKYDSLTFATNTGNRNTNRERFVTPTLQPAEARGRFESNLAGLDINPSTGVINLDRSEAGLRYTITFTPDDTNLRPSTVQVTIAGVDYLDSMYVLSRSRNRAYPILNADRNYTRSRNVPGLPRNASARFASNYGFTSPFGSIVDSATGIINMQRAKDVILFRRRDRENFSNPLNLTISYTLRDSLTAQADTTRTGGGTGGTGGTGGGSNVGGGTGGTGGTGSGTGGTGG
ncbi:MAG: hypothetical protein MUC97_16820, partial [Bernardetiaceae bacterium]|nr:hypothetical protein [Bernardetiaceae bacterium]